MNKIISEPMRLTDQEIEVATICGMTPAEYAFGKIMVKIEKRRAQWRKASKKYRLKQKLLRSGK